MCREGGIEAATASRSADRVRAVKVPSTTRCLRVSCHCDRPRCDSVSTPLPCYRRTAPTVASQSQPELSLASETYDVTIRVDDSTRRQGARRAFPKTLIWLRSGAPAAS